MAKEKSEYKIWLEHSEDLKHLAEFELSKDKEYQNATAKQKKQMMDDKWAELYLSLYWDTPEAIMIRKEKNMPDLPEFEGIHFEQDGYEMYFERSRDLAAFYIYREKQGGHIDFSKMESFSDSSYIGEYKADNGLGDITTHYVCPFIDHKKKVVYCGRMTVAGMLALHDGELPNHKEARLILQSYYAFKRLFTDEDIKKFASKYYPGQEEDFCYIYHYDDEKAKRLKKEKHDRIAAFEEHKENYNPQGRRVKVREMRPGYLYTFTDMSLEYYNAWKYGKDGDIDESKFEHLCSDCSTPIMNVGLMYVDEFSLSWSGKIDVRLCYVQKEEHIELNYRKTGADRVVKDGRYIWRAYNNGCYYDVSREMDPDDEVVEVYPFRIFIKMRPEDPKNSYVEWIPDPDKWTTVPAGTPYNRKTDYVDVWTESDFKILITVCVIAFVCCLGGIDGMSFGATMIILMCLAFRTKHNRIRREVIAEREKIGVRGPGMDDAIRR